MECEMCSSSDVLVDKDYQMFYRCYLHYKAHNPNVLKDFEQGLIVKVEKKTNPCINCGGIDIIITIDNKYACLSCKCSIGYKFDDKKAEYCKKLYYKRKYHLEKFIKRYRNYENFDRIKVIMLFNKIVNEILCLNLKRKRISKLI